MSLSALRLVPGVTLLLLALPVIAGLAGTIAPALAPGAMRGLLSWPGLVPAARLSLTTGLGSTVAALALTLLIVATLRGTRVFTALIRLLSPLLSVPHAAAALGLAFLIAPSGWIARALSPWATGWQVPPDLLILNDPMGLALTFGLIAKEVPFLLLMALAALPQTDAVRRITLAETLGYSRSAAFALTVLPALYRSLRLPVYAVLAYAMTSVDMAQILGPSRPPTLSVRITLWMTDPDLTLRPMASAAALLQLALVAMALGLWRGAELACRRLIGHMARHGMRLPEADRILRPLALAAGGGLTLALIAGLAGLALWSVAGLWQFLDALPQSYALKTWGLAGSGLWDASLMTLALGGLSVALALTLTLGCLQAEHHFALRQVQASQWVLWLPLLVPQIAFLPGIHALALATGTSGFAAALAVHSVFVLPYTFLSLAPSWRGLDPRLIQVAESLGASPARVFWTLRLPLLLRPVLTAAAVGFAVSVGQYLPTLLLGAGRIETLTTEAVALSSGGNRRVIGAYGLLQMLLPATGFALATGLPVMIYRNRRGMAP